jgi:hypothetical protein
MDAIEGFSRLLADMFPPPVHPSECATATDAIVARYSYEAQCRAVVEARHRFVSENMGLFAALLPSPVITIHADAIEAPVGGGAR